MKGSTRRSSCPPVGAQFYADSNSSADTLAQPRRAQPQTSSCSAPRTRCLNHVRAQPSVDGSGRASTVPVAASACAARRGRARLSASSATLRCAR
eukprot:scaffold59827_cov38-Phaeocystis_antarctica.AAC.3